jgi:hypothetical protein
MAFVYARPDVDNIDGAWKNELNTQTNLFASIDETVASDADFIISDNNPNSDIVKLSLSDPGAAVGSPATVRYRYKSYGGVNGLALGMNISLLEGANVIATWTDSNISASFVLGQQTLTAPQLAAISDFNNLFLSFEAYFGWILATGFWNDNAFWRDMAIWVD